MRKKLVSILLILISIVIPYNVYAISTTEAKEEINLSEDCNLALNFIYEDYEFNDVDVNIYYIASVSNDYRYQLVNDLMEYPIKINGIKTDLEWNSLEEVIDSYILADNIEPTLSEVVIDNKIMLSDLEAGLYFIKIDKIDTDDYTLLFDSFLINLPELIEDGTWNYEVEVYSKAESYEPKYDDIEYTIVKEWVDDGKNRPRSIEVEIYDDGDLYDTIILSSDNNFTYKFITKDDGSEFNVLEKNVPDGYKVSISNNDKTFIIMNIDPNSKGGNPHTYDDIKLYFYLLIGSVLGLVLLLISLIMKKKNEVCE